MGCKNLIIQHDNTTLRFKINYFIIFARFTPPWYPTATERNSILYIETELSLNCVFSLSSPISKTIIFYILNIHIIVRQTRYPYCGYTSYTITLSTCKWTTYSSNHSRKDYWSLILSNETNIQVLVLWNQCSGLSVMNPMFRP